MPHVACRLLGPQECQASPAGLANGSPSGVGAVKLSGHRTSCPRGARHGRAFVLSPVQSAASAESQFLSQLHPGSNESSCTGTRSEEPRGRQFLALTTVPQGTAYGARTKHRQPGWTVPRARYLDAWYAHYKGLNMRGAGNREPWHIAPSARPRPRPRSPLRLGSSIRRNRDTPSPCPQRPLPVPQTAQSALPELQPTRFLHVPAHT